ncbi:MAG: peptidoglycan-associated lipoprotein Pal [Alphaproteobacteria bacterium]|nr:peptidoglycan-associated lipoprotein Pal [Alphaproteobacteria bacterium]
MLRSIATPLSLTATVLLAAACAAKQPAPEPAAVEVTTWKVDPVELEAVTVIPVYVQQIEDNFRRVWFEFDSAELTPESHARLQENVRLLDEHPDVHIRVQGHADERGTTDYNLALGQRRAEAIRDALVAEGISPVRIDTISYGEERPLVDRSTPSAWSRNRRAEFVITWGDDEAIDGSTEVVR